MASLFGDLYNPLQYTQLGAATEIGGVIVKAGAGAAVDTVTDNALSSLEDALAKGLAWMVDTTSTWWVKAPSVRVQQPVTPGVDPVSAPPIEVVAAIRGWMWPIVITVALCGLTIQAARMALQHKPQPLLDIARGLLMVGLTTGIGVLVVQQALDAGDAFSDWVLSTDGQQLAPVMKHVLGVDNQHLAATGFVIVYCLIALVVSIVQAILMMFREASIPILTGMLVLAVRRLRPRRQPGGWALAGPSLADDRDLAALTPAGATARARALRPSLAPLPRLSETDRGWPIGDLTPGGTPLYGSDEDVAIAVMAPRAGKTTALAVPVILDAPGAVVATANKADLWATTAALRAANGTVWVFDPQQIAYAPPIWWWNPLAAVRGVEDADRLASHFLQEIRGGQASRDFWAAAAGDLLASLLLAAATNDRSLIDVYEWLNDSASPRPADLLDDHGYRAVAAGLRGRQAGAPETREGVYETARAAARCLRNDQILTWVTPPATDGDTRALLDVDRFAASSDTLYLLSKDDEGAASPLVAAFVDQVMRAAVRRAEAAGGRLDPPMRIMLDEAANICKIADLPRLYSHLGSRGLVTITILQSYRQGVGVWGEQGMDALWSAATITFVGA
uniref:type IV secretory system conjugative DNA transfer family protein n=1 Tax=Frankia sp. Cj3 TaxID=2880976 RepID=UPI001EF649C2